MDRDYIVAFDENGQPYIAHIFSERARRAAAEARSKAHKYIAKWGEGAKARYFYTKEELDAAMGRGKETVSRAADKVRTGVREVTGAAARDRMRAADRRAIQAHGAHSNAIVTSRSARQANIDARARAADSRTAYEKSEAAYREAYDKYYGDEKDFGKSALRALSRRERERHVADKERLEQLDSERKAGYQDQVEARFAVDRATDAERRAMSERRMAEREADKAERDSGVARAEYAATPLDKIEAAKESASDWLKIASNIIKSHSLDALADIKDAKENAASWVKTVVSTAKDTLETASDKMKDAIKRLSGGSNKEDNTSTTKDDDDTTKNDVDLTHDGSYLRIISDAILKGIPKKAVEKHERNLSESEIIDRISGGDETTGSCSSLALTYIANKLGYDVLDFRGGSSTDLFADPNTILRMISMIDKVSPGSARQSRLPAAIDSARQNLELVEEGKEYYFAAGCHAAMVKKENGQLYYLELQSPVSNNNGWQVLDDVALTWRFGCYYVNQSKGMLSVLIDSEAFNNDAFVSLFSYINTDEKRQIKGGDGSVK